MAEQTEPATAEPAPVDPSSAPAAATEPADGTSEPTDTTDAAETDEQEPSPNREAAKYRRELRDTQSERDALQARIDQQDRAAAETLAGQQLASADDLWRYGVELDSLRGDDGSLDPEKVTAAVTELATARPYLAGVPVDPRGLLAAQADRFQRGEAPVKLRFADYGTMAPDPSVGNHGGGVAPRSDGERWQRALKGK